MENGSPLECKARTNLIKLRYSDTSKGIEVHPFFFVLLAEKKDKAKSGTGALRMIQLPMYIVGLVRPKYLQKSKCKKNLLISQKVLKIMLGLLDQSSAESAVARCLGSFRARPRTCQCSRPLPLASAWHAAV